MSNQGTVPYFQIDTAFQTGFIDKKMLWERQLYKIQNKIVISLMNIEDSTNPESRKEYIVFHFYQKWEKLSYV